MKLFWSRVKAVALREINIWKGNHAFLYGMFVPLIVSAIFYSTFFGKGMPTDLPIGIVDEDCSSISRRFIRELDATQLGKVIVFPTYGEARREMQKGDITSICVIPKGLAADIQANRQPCFSFYINGLYFVGGSMAYKDLLTMLNMTGGGVQREFLRAKGVDESRIMGLLRPIDIETHQIGNSTVDYGIYLLGGLLPGILAMSVVLILIYSLGCELKYSTSRTLMQTNGNDIMAVICGKMLLYVPIFTILGWGVVALLYVIMGFPFAGNLWWMLLDTFLIVLASASVGVICIACIPICRFAMSIGCIYSTLALSLSGFSLPCESFLPAISAICPIFPLRHYYQFFIHEGIFANGFAGFYPEMIHLLLFPVVAILLMPRLCKAFNEMNYPKN